MDEISQNHKPFPENAPGDFYVEENCCTMCEVPFGEAPELFGVADSAGYEHCYVKRQPRRQLNLSRWSVRSVAPNWGASGIVDRTVLFNFNWSQPGKA